mmetsp:Transcript_10677/g.17822  ORF Transcript_10677/g.17822 Transcript_10677/m.17822 type:complete len:244 (-) Transcript_10677:23-754(-)
MLTNAPSHRQQPPRPPRHIVQHPPPVNRVAPAHRRRQPKLQRNLQRARQRTRPPRPLPRCAPRCAPVANRCNRTPSQPTTYRHSALPAATTTTTTTTIAMARLDAWRANERQVTSHRRRANALPYDRSSSRACRRPTTHVSRGRAPTRARVVLAPPLASLRRPRCSARRRTTATVTSGAMSSVAPSNPALSCHRRASRSQHSCRFAKHCTPPTHTNHPHTHTHTNTLIYFVDTYIQPQLLNFK